MFHVFFQAPLCLRGVLGLGDGLKNPEIMEMRVFGFSNKQVEILLDQIEAE